MRMIAALVCSALLAATANAATGIFTVRQDAQGNAQVLVISPVDGSIVAQSDITFNLQNPLTGVETTVDPVNGHAYLLYLDITKGTQVWQLDGRSPTLDVLQHWTVPNLFFDLQYDTTQQTLYGIDVVSRFGRTLSNITLTPNTPNAVSIEHLVAMPMDWYVNASSFDPQTSRYFALLNNFPTLPNATTAQKFVVANFSQPVVPPNVAPATVYDLTLTGAVSWHFVSWDAVRQGVVSLVTTASMLFPDQWTTATAFIDPVQGFQEMGDAIETLETGPTAPGPLMMDPQTGYYFMFMQSVQSGNWSLMTIQQNADVTVLQSYGPEWTVRAATWAPW